jgi:hypothetical protein
MMDGIQTGGSSCFYYWDEAKERYVLVSWSNPLVFWADPEDVYAAFDGQWPWGGVLTTAEVA